MKCIYSFRNQEQLQILTASNNRNLWKHSARNHGVIQRDYALLDEIHPKRIKSVEEWLRKEDQKGLEQGLGSLFDRVSNLRPVLKIAEDGRTGKL